jgi:hypothetical protein
MPEVEAISVTRDEHIERIVSRFDVREVTTAFVEPMVILETAVPFGVALVELEAVGLEIAGRARLCAEPTSPSYYAVFAQGAV